MVLGDDRRQFARPGGAKPLGPDRRMAAVNLKATGKSGAPLEHRPQDAGRNGGEENGEAPIDHGKGRTLLAVVVQQGGLTKEGAGGRFHPVDGLEDIEPMALIVDGELKKDGGKRRPQDLTDGCSLFSIDPSGSVTPELTDAMQSAGHG